MWCMGLKICMGDEHQTYQVLSKSKRYNLYGMTQTQELDEKQWRLE